MHVSTVLSGERWQISLEFKLWQLWAMDARRKGTSSERTVCILTLWASSPSPLPPIRDSVQDGALMECLHSHNIFNSLFFEIIVQTNLSLPFLLCKPSHTCVLSFFMFAASLFINFYFHVWTYEGICICISNTYVQLALSCLDNVNCMCVSTAGHLALDNQSASFFLGKTIILHSALLSCL